MRPPAHPTRASTRSRSAAGCPSLTARAAERRAGPSPIERPRLDQGPDVLRQARAAEPEAGVEEGRPDPIVEADRVHHLRRIDPECFAEAADLVRGRDPDREHRVRGVLDHLRGRAPAPDDRAGELLVEPVEHLRSGRLVGADHDAARREEVLDRAPLAEELGVDHDVEPLPGARAGALVDGGPDHPGGGPRGHRALDHERMAPPGAGEGSPDRPARRPHGAEVASAAGARGGADAEEGEIARHDRGRKIGARPDPFTVVGEEALEPGFVEPHRPLFQPVYHRLIPIHERYPVAETGEAGTGDRPHVPGTNDGDLHRVHVGFDYKKRVR